MDEAQDLGMRIIEINVSEEIAREEPLEGARDGFLKDGIGCIESVPKIVFYYNDGEAIPLESNRRQMYYGYGVDRIMEFALSLEPYVQEFEEAARIAAEEEERLRLEEEARIAAEEAARLAAEEAARIAA